MPTGVYKRKPVSEETRKKLREANKGEKNPMFGKTHTKEVREKISNGHKGKILSKLTKEKISKARIERKKRLGYLNSKKTRERICIACKGRSVWNKGIIKEEDIRVLRLSENLIPFKKGNVPFNKGKTSETDKRVLGKENHYNWQGGKSFEPYGLEFNNYLRTQIRERDNYQCQQCFKHQDELFTKKGNHRKLVVHHIDYNKQNNNPNNLISLCLSCHIKTNYNRDYWTNYFIKKSNNYVNNRLQF